MQDHMPSAKEVRPNFVMAAPDCPVCKSGMRLVQVMPIAFAPDLDEVSYVCDECGQTTRRALRRP
jgi:C4-type Zn-finger protein